MNKRIVILGAGESGIGTAILAHKHGYDVFISDSGIIKDVYKKEIELLGFEYEECQHTAEKIFTATVVMKSPGISDTMPIIQELKSLNIPVISEIEFASLFVNPDAKIIAITGSNGKTTTASMIYQMFVNDNRNVALGGNIGNSFARIVAIGTFDYYVLEISSFQLDGCYTFRPHVAIILNITPDHLDRYNYQFSNYVASKFRITMNQTEKDYLIYCMDDEATIAYLATHKTKAQLLSFTNTPNVTATAYIKDNILHFNNHKPFTMSIFDLSLRGQHNYYNNMAAGIAGNFMELRKDAIRDAMANFVNIEHRLEFVANVGGIEFINDSKATNINSAWYALDTMKKPIVWVAGGHDKGAEFEVLQPLVRNKVKAIVCLGIDNRKIHEAYSNLVDVIINTDNAKDCVEMAYRLARSGDVVLLSPACASFDLFKNYEDRGSQFKYFVQQL